MVLEIIIIIILVFLSAFFSLSETALVGFNKFRLHHHVRHNKPRAKVILDTVQHPDQFIGTVLVGNNLVNVACASIATGIFIRFFGVETGMLVTMFVMTFVLLIFGETIPKIYASSHSETLAYQIIYPI